MVTQNSGQSIRPWLGRRSRLGASSLVLAFALGGLSACSGDEQETGGGAANPTPEEVLAAAKQTLDETSGVAVSLKADDLPGALTGVTGATGTAVHPSAFEGSFDISVSGVPATVDVIAVEGTTYAKNRFLLPDWTEIDPEDYGAPDPAALMDPDGGFSGLLGSAADVEAGDAVRGGSDNSEILTEYTGTISSSAVTALIPTAEGDFTFTYTISDEDQLREAVITGAFYGAEEGDVTYTLGLDDYGTDKDITAP